MPTPRRIPNIPEPDEPVVLEELMNQLERRRKQKEKWDLETLQFEMEDDLPPRHPVDEFVWKWVGRLFVPFVLGLLVADILGIKI